MINRRDFMKLGAMSSLYMAAAINGMTKIPSPDHGKIRLGGPIFKEFDDPTEWIKAHKDWGYSAAYCPLDNDASEEVIRAFEIAANKHNLIIAEVGAWSNPISVDEKQRKEAIEYCAKQLELADNIGANCCVNIAGSRNPDSWDGPHADNLTEEAFDVIVETTQKIIDTVKPRRTYFALETMPYVFPNSIESYERLIKKIDRDRFAVHFDPVNLINSIDRYYNTTDVIKEGFKKLGKFIKSCHGKDVIIRDGFPVNIAETQPGLGNLDYRAYLTELSKLDNVPLMLEHMEEPEEYRAARDYVVNVAGKNGIDIRTL